MAKKIIDIDGYIGEGGFSSGYVKLGLRDAGEDPVELHINSLGGDVSHAIAIHDMIKAHGNVTAHYSGMSASSATIISLGASKVTMTKDSFYLIHKPMMWVDAWGALNEDELKDLISKFESQLENAQRITLQLAKMYAEKTSKPVKDIMELMKKEQWLSAKEAKSWGFIDEIVEPVKVTNYAENLKLVALISGNGLPPIPREAPVNNYLSIEERINAAGESWLTKMKEFFTSNNKNQKPMAGKTLKLALLCAVLSVESLELNNDGAFVNEEQLNLLEGQLKMLQDAKTAADTALAAANSRAETAEAALAKANSSLDELTADAKTKSTTAEKIEAVRAELAKKPAVAATGAQGAGDPPRKVIDGADPVTQYAKGIV